MSSKTLTDISCHVRSIREKAIAVADGTTEEHEGRCDICNPRKKKV